MLVTRKTKRLKKKLNLKEKQKIYICQIVSRKKGFTTSNIFGRISKLELPSIASETKVQEHRRQSIEIGLK